MIIPIQSTIIYLTIKLNRRLSRFNKRVLKNEADSKKYLVQDKEIRKEFNDNGTLRYISDFAKFPVTTNNKIEYFSLGDDSFDTIIEELNKAKKNYIY